jgi:hypothetical protein
MKVSDRQGRVGGIFGEPDDHGAVSRGGQCGTRTASSVSCGWEIIRGRRLREDTGPKAVHMDSQSVKTTEESGRIKR